MKKFVELSNKNFESVEGGMKDVEKTFETTE